MMSQFLVNFITRGISRVAFEKPPTKIYYLYLRENFARLRTENESNKLPFDRSTLTSIIKEDYKNLSSAEKLELEDKLRFQQEEFMKIKNMESEIRHTVIMKYAEDRGLPKKIPRSVFNLYSQENISNKANYPDLTPKDKFKQIVKDFKIISESELKIYSDRIAELKLEHEKSLKEWANANGVPYFSNRQKMAYYFYYKQVYNS